MKEKSISRNGIKLIENYNFFSCLLLLFYNNHNYNENIMIMIAKALHDKFHSMGFYSFCALQPIKSRLLNFC